MVRQWKAILVSVCMLGGRAFAGDVISELEVEGVKYENVRWGPVNQGKVVMFHNRGVATVALDRLPEEYARQLGYQPSDKPIEPRTPRPPPANSPVFQPKRPAPKDRIPPQERPAFEAARDQKMVVGGELTDKSALVQLTGFIRAKATVTGEERETTGTMLELAKRKKTERPIPANLEMRPGLWEGTGEEVFLRDFVPEVERDSLWRGFGQEADPIRGYRTFVIAEELTYEQWKKRR